MALFAVVKVSLGYECCLTSEIEDEIPKQAIGVKVTDNPSSVKI